GLQAAPFSLAAHIIDPTCGNGGRATASRDPVMGNGASALGPKLPRPSSTMAENLGVAATSTVSRGIRDLPGASSDGGERAGELSVAAIRQPSDCGNYFCPPCANGFRAAYTKRFTGVGTPSCLPKSTTLPASQGSSRRLLATRSTAIDGVQLSGTLARNERQKAAASESRSIPAARPTAITSCITSSMSGAMSGSLRMGPIELRVRAQIPPAPTRPTNFCQRSLLMLS